MIIFCDGVFDLFHRGHVNHFKKIKDLYPNAFLLVGVLSDKIATSYKRVPVYNEIKRTSLVSSCKYVDNVTLDYPVLLTEEFIISNKIDVVVHGFSTLNDYENQLKYFEVPIRLNIMKIIDYTNGISTTHLIDDIRFAQNKKKIVHESNKNGWDKIWELKGCEETDNVVELNGYDNTNFDRNTCYKTIMYTLDIKPHEKILEIGCGSGSFSKLFSINFDYFGIDYSRSLINKNISLTNSKVYNCEAISLPFKNKYFNHSFCVSVFEYFPTKEYAFKVLDEIERVTKTSIYIVNIRSKTHENRPTKYKYAESPRHLIFTHYDFIKYGYSIGDATYEKESRFSALKKI
jgi:cytidyltransferase-like protein